MRSSAALAGLLALVVLASALSCGGSEGEGSSSSASSNTTTTVDLSGKRVLVVGDSLAVLLGEALDRLPAGQRPVIRNAALIGCGILPGERVSYGRWQSTPVGCDDWPERWAQALDELDPDVVVVLDGFWDAYDWVLDGARTEFGTPAWDTFASEQLGAAMDLLGSRGARVIWLQSPYFQPGASDKRAVAYYQAHGEYRSAFDDQRVRHLNDLIATVAAGRECVVVPDARDCLCPSDAYTDVLDGVVVRNDGVHLTTEGADRLAEWLVPYLRSAATTCQPIG